MHYVSEQQSCTDAVACTPHSIWHEQCCCLCANFVSVVSSGTTVHAFAEVQSRGDRAAQVQDILGALPARPQPKRRPAVTRDATAPAIAAVTSDALAIATAAAAAATAGIVHGPPRQGVVPAARAVAAAPAPWGRAAGAQGGKHDYTTAFVSRIAHHWIPKHAYLSSLA